MAKNPKTAKSSAALSADVLAHIGNAAYAQARIDVSSAESRTLAVNELKAAGIADKRKQDSIRNAYVDRYCAARMFPSAATISAAELEAARIMLAKPGKNAKSNERRTEAEETIYDAARASWSRMLKACDTVTSSKVGGARTKAGKARTKAGKAPAKGANGKANANEPARPKTPGDVVGHVASVAAALHLYVNKNGQRKLAIPASIVRLVTEFNAQVKIAVGEWQKAQKPAAD